MQKTPNTFPVGIFTIFFLKHLKRVKTSEQDKRVKGPGEQQYLCAGYTQVAVPAEGSQLLDCLRFSRFQTTNQIFPARPPNYSTGSHKENIQHYIIFAKKKQNSSDLLSLHPEKRKNSHSKVMDEQKT